jgi:hypothetical protein
LLIKRIGAYQDFIQRKILKKVDHLLRKKRELDEDNALAQQKIVDTNLQIDIINSEISRVQKHIRDLQQQNLQMR